MSLSLGTVIYNALRIAGVLEAPLRGPSNSEISDAFTTCNTMLDAWNTERLMVYAIDREVFTLVPGQQVYQIGTGAPDFNITRPPRIEKAGIITLDNPAQPLELPMDVLNYEQWANIPVKNVPATFPFSLYYDMAFPIGNINFWPIPTTAPQVALYLWTLFSQFVTVGDTVAFPPAYVKAIQYNLAVELMDIFPRSFLTEAQRQRVIAQAIATKAVLKRLNAPNLVMSCDPALSQSGSGFFNYYTGTSTRP